MAEDFHPNYCWNNSASGGGFHRRNSTSTTNSAGAAASSDWPSTTEISQSKHTPNFLWNQTLTGKTECTRPFSRLEVGESSSINPYKEVNSTSSMLQGLVEPGSTRFERHGLDSGQVVRDYYQSQLMAFRGVSDEKQKRLWKELGDNDYNNPVWNNASAGFYPSHQPSLLRTQLSDESKFSCRKTGLDLVGDWEERGSRTAPEHKKSRIETPSAMAANITVIGKEKLRDRVTALQQLVSPFGKTDTASVLQEAIEYIKFLHDQVNVLCAPYFKTGRPIPQNQNSVNKCVKVKEEEQRAGDLRSRGLCLVPMEIIYPAESETSIATTTSEFWTPIHGRTYW